MFRIVVEVRSGDVVIILGRDVGWSRRNRGDEVMRRLVDGVHRCRGQFPLAEGADKRC